MNAILQPLEAEFAPMHPGQLDDVVRVEKLAYDHPWTEGNFVDSINAAYQTQMLVAGKAPSPELLGYFVAMKGVDEVHLLNLTVAPEHQRQGWARIMLDALAIWARGQGAQWLWLEVRVSNARAKAIYERYGFRQVGTRRDYYPDTPLKREDAIVMSFDLSAPAS